MIEYWLVGAHGKENYDKLLADAGKTADFPVRFLGDIPDEKLSELYAQADIFAPCALGAIITLIYDAATNAGHAVAMDLVSQLPQVVLAGIAFTALHIGANAAIFAILGPPALFVVEKRRGP